jgi:iron complex outermembrane receptor protein
VRRLLAAALPALASSLAGIAPVDADQATDAGAALPDIRVQATAMPGTRIDIDKIPGNVQILSAGDLVREGSASLTGALDSNLSSVNINDDLDDPFQPDILYRGFEASPVLGTPQGLAVYQNGVRINEAFGDTVNWDLFPDVAINQVELVSSSPVYGLNALGGAISVTMKNGFTYDGADVELSGGSYGQRALTAQYGIHSDSLGFYVGGRALDWNGWRAFSNDRMREVYSVFSVHTDRGTIDLAYTRADNTMNGQGAAPVQELAVSRSLVFTGPQTNVNTLDFLTLNGTLKLTEFWSLQTVLHYRQFVQSVANGNATDYAACTTPAGVLCQPDGVTPLMNAAGQPLPDISDGGALAIGENDFESIHTDGRGAALQATDDASIFGHGNQFTLGAAVDYALTEFRTGAEIGLINAQLLVLPSNLLVDTPENSAAAAADGDPVPIDVDSVNRNFGAYLTDTFDVTRDLAVTASGRYNIAHVDLTDRLGTNLDGNNRFVHFNPAVGATFKTAPTATVYGGLSQNTRTPTASEIECSDPTRPCLLPTNLAGDPPNLRQVIARTAELGVRGSQPGESPGAGKIAWNLSVFRTLLHDDIFGIATSVSQGFFRNIGDTRRQGLEAGLSYRAGPWSGYANYSFVQAEFRSPLTVPSPSNPFQNPSGDIAVRSGDRLPGIPGQRLKLGAEYRIRAGWTVGASLNLVGSFYYVGDESNQLAPISGYHVVGLHASCEPVEHMEVFAQITNLFNAKYSTWGILSDPTGVGAPGIPASGATNGPGVDNRFLSPAAPFQAFGGVRITF